VRKATTVLLTFALVLVLGCAKRAEESPAVGEKEGYEEVALPEAAPAEPKFGRAESEEPLAERASPPAKGDGARAEDVLAGVSEANAAGIAGELKLVKTAELASEIDDVEKGFEKVYAIAAAEKAIVVETSRSVAEEGYVFGSITLKVHPSKFDETIKALRGVGRPLSENSTTEDVTQEYVDLQARLENAEAARGRYLEILATRTGAVSDVLEVEREIERVMENIERLKGELRYLDSRIGLSTIAIRLEEPHAAVPAGYIFGKAIRDAFRIAVRIFIYIIQAVIVLVPFIVILVVLVLIIRLIIWFFERRRRKAKQAAINA